MNTGGFGASWPTWPSYVGVGGAAAPRGEIEKVVSRAWGAMLGLGRGSLRCRVGALERRTGYLVVKIRAVPRQARPHIVFVGGIWGGMRHVCRKRVDGESSEWSWGLRDEGFTASR